MRRIHEIREAEQETADILWYDHMLQRMHQIEHHGGQYESESGLDAMLQRIADLEDLYGKDNLDLEDPFEAGLLHGRLETLRWFLGSDWGSMDCEDAHASDVEET